MTLVEGRMGASSFATNAAVVACVCLLSAVAPAKAQERPDVRADQVRVEYVTPTNPAHQSVYKLLKENRVLEKLQEVLMPLRLPAPLVLRTDGCDGESNAWYEDQRVTVCYEYIEELIRNAPQGTTRRGITREDRADDRGLPTRSRACGLRHSAPADLRTRGRRSRPVRRLYSAAAWSQGGAAHHRRHRLHVCARGPAAEPGAQGFCRRARCSCATNV